MTKAIIGAIAGSFITIVFMSQMQHDKKINQSNIMTNNARVYFNLSMRTMKSYYTDSSSYYFGKMNGMYEASSIILK